MVPGEGRSVRDGLAGRMTKCSLLSEAALGPAVWPRSPQLRLTLVLRDTKESLAEIYCNGCGSREDGVRNTGDKRLDHGFGVPKKSNIRDVMCLLCH